MYIYYYSEQMTESENENDLLDLDHRDHKIFSKKVGERFVDRNEKFVPLQHK